MAAEKLTNVELESIRLLDSKARTVPSETIANFDLVSIAVLLVAISVEVYLLYLVMADCAMLGWRGLLKL